MNAINVGLSCALCNSRLRKTPKEQRSRSHRDGNLKSRTQIFRPMRSHGTGKRKQFTISQEKKMYHFHVLKCFD